MISLVMLIMRGDYMNIEKTPNNQLTPEQEKLLKEWENLFGSLSRKALDDKNIDRE